MHLEHSSQSNKARRHKSPITDKRKQDKVIHVSERQPKSVQRLNQEKTCNLKKRNHQDSDDAQKLRSQQKLIKVKRKKGLEKVSEDQNGVQGTPAHGYKRNKINIKNSSDSKQNLEFRLSSKIWQLMSRDFFPNLDNEKNAGLIGVTDSEMKRYIISVIKKYNKKELKRFNHPRVTQTSKQSVSSSRHRSRNKRKAIKRRVRRQLWQWVKTAIKNNEHWTKLLEDNNVAIDNINIDKIDLSLIDLDALGIENKLLKRTITWLFK